MNILLIGKDGQLGKAFEKECINQNLPYTAIGREHCDITDHEAMDKILGEVKPTHVINATAYNLVDKAQSDGKDLAFAVNAKALEHLADWAHQYKAKLIHFSSDYVFDGKKGHPYTEEDIPNPLNEYGKSKLEGENAVLKYPEHLVLRTSWVYGDGEQNFIHKFLKNAEQKDILPGTIDEVSTPTSTRLLVTLTFLGIRKDISGLFHATNSGHTSRADWAREILNIKHLDKTVEDVSLKIWNLPAPRPAFSPLDNTRIATILDIHIPDWKEELKNFLEHSKA